MTVNVSMTLSMEGYVDASVSLSIDLEHPWHPYANVTRASTDLNWKWEMSSDVSAKAAHISDDDADVDAKDEYIE